MTIREIIEAVREKNLTREQLERYYDHLVSLWGSLNLEMADLTKKEALFFDKREGTAIASTRAWAVTIEGQRQIEVKYQLRATEKLISSVKHRIFNTL